MLYLASFIKNESAMPNLDRFKKKMKVQCYTWIDLKKKNNIGIMLYLDCFSEKMKVRLPHSSIKGSRLGIGVISILISHIESDLTSWQPITITKI